MKDPLAGALPEQTNMASQPLTGLPSSMTGGVGTGMIPPQTGQPGLAPAPPPNSTQVGGAPLSGNDADTRQGGAGADFDYVKDRGKPDEFHANNLLEAGSEKATQLASDIAGGGRVGEGMNQEDINREGTRANKAMNMDTPEKAAAVVKQVVTGPLADVIKSEIASEDITPDDGVARLTQTDLNINGAESVDDVNAAVDKNAKELGVKDKGVIGRSKEAMVKWWKLGKDDPKTPNIDERETVQVTGFMGGMNRQELGMFVFQWGAMLMANSSEGFGAVGTASLGAMQGHQGRQATETASALSAEEMDIKRKNADSASRSADATVTRADAYAEGIGAVRGGVGEWKREFYRSIGWSDEKIAQAAEGILTTEQIFDEVSSDLRDQRAKASTESPMLPDSARGKTRLPDGTEVPTSKLTEDQILMLATEASKKQVEARGALSPRMPPDPEDAFSSAMDKYGSDTP